MSCTALALVVTIAGRQYYAYPHFDLHAVIKTTSITDPRRIALPH